MAPKAGTYTVTKTTCATARAVPDKALRPWSSWGAITGKLTMAMTHHTSSPIMIFVKIPTLSPWSPGAPA